MKTLAHALCGHLSGPGSQCLGTGLLQAGQCWQGGKVRLIRVRFVLVHLNPINDTYIWEFHVMLCNTLVL